MLGAFILSGPKSTERPFTKGRVSVTAGEILDLHGPALHLLQRTSDRSSQERIPATDWQRVFIWIKKTRQQTEACCRASGGIVDDNNLAIGSWCAKGFLALGRTTAAQQHKQVEATSGQLVEGISEYLVPGDKKKVPVVKDGRDCHMVHP